MNRRAAIDPVRQKDPQQQTRNDLEIPKSKMARGLMCEDRIITSALTAGSFPSSLGLNRLGTALQSESGRLTKSTERCPTLLHRSITMGRRAL